jgi:hypothetical protein
MDKAKELSDTLYQVIKLLFEGGRPPEQNYRTCDGFLSLYRKTDPDIFQKACLEALSCRCYSYSFLRKVIDHFKHNPKDQEALPSLPEHANIRGKEYYSQLNINF